MRRDDNENEILVPSKPKATLFNVNCKLCLIVPGTDIIPGTGGVNMCANFGVRFEFFSTNNCLLATKVIREEIILTPTIITPITPIPLLDEDVITVITCKIFCSIFNFKNIDNKHFEESNVVTVSCRKKESN